MAARFEYDVIVMERKPGEADQVYRWRCLKHGTCLEHNGLEQFLNAMGERGWHLVAHTSDGRFGSSLILQRLIEGTAPVVDIKHTDTPDRPLSPEEIAKIIKEATLDSGPTAEVTAALLAEVKALREQVAAQGLTSRPPDAARRLQEEQWHRAALAAQEATKEAVAQLAVSLAPRSTPALPPPPAVLGPEAAAAIEQMAERLVAQVNLAPTMTRLDPEAMDLLERVLMHEVDRHDPPAPPTGPTVAVLDGAALVALQEAQRAFCENVLAVASREVKLPEINVTACATLTEDAEARLVAAFGGVERTTLLDDGSLARLGETLRQAVASAPCAPITALLAPEVAEQLRAAVAAAPAPVIRAQADLAPAAVAALRAALTDAVRGIVMPSVDVNPRVQATLDEAAVARLAVRTVTLAPESLVGLEAAVSRAVSRAVEAALARSVEEPQEVQVEAKRWFQWPWAPSKLRPAFSR